MAVIRADISALDPRPRPRARGYLPYRRACNLHSSPPPPVSPLSPILASSRSTGLSAYPSIHLSIHPSSSANPYHAPNSLYFSLPSTLFSFDQLPLSLSFSLLLAFARTNVRPWSLPGVAHPHFLHLVTDAQCTAGSHYRPRSGYHSFGTLARRRCSPANTCTRAHTYPGLTEDRPRRTADLCRQTISLSFDSRVTERPNGAR